jgi:YD repeat-containing protein
MKTNTRQLVWIALLLALALPAIAHAHASVFPRASAPGAYERYVLRVPNEKGVATTRVEIRFPAEVRVISFSEVAGWTLETVRDSAGRVTAAVWTGTLPPERFVELPFIAVNPTGDARLVWPAYQTYADGERVEWTGPEGSQAPASVTEIGEAETGGSSRLPLYLGAAALLVGLLSLGLVLRR